MKQRAIALLLTVGMVVGMLAGCGNGNEKKQVSTEKQDESSVVGAESETGEEEEIVTVKWCMRTDAQEDDEAVFEAINEILRERYHLEIEPIIISSGEYNDRMNLMSTSGEDYDICFTAGWANNFYTNLDREAFLPLNDLLASDAAELLRSALPAEYQTHCAVATVNGTIYAIPNYQIQYSQIGAYIQKDLAEEYGLDVDSISSIRDLEPFMEWVRDNKEGIWPLSTSSSIGAAHDYVGADCSYAGLESNPGVDSYAASMVQIDRDDTDYTAHSLFDNKYWVENVRLLNSYYKNGFIRSDVATVTDHTADLAANRYAIIISTAKPGGEASFEASYGKEYIQIPFGVPYKRATAGNETMTAISVNSKNPEAAIKMIGVMWSDKEIFNMFLYGLEGKNYTKVSENRIEQIAESGYERSELAWSVGNQFQAYILPSQEDDVWEVTAANNAVAEQSHLTGFTFDGTSVETEVAQINSVKGEYELQYFYVEDFDAWLAEYEAKVMAAGLETCIEEVQAQIDAWRTANGK